MKTNTSPQTEAAQHATATNIIQLNLAVHPGRRSARLPLPRGEGQGEGQTGTGFLIVPGEGQTSSSRPRRSVRRHQTTRARAAWWFQQMRRVVDSAVEWRPTPPARPEQVTLDLRRPTEVTVR